MLQTLFILKIRWVETRHNFNLFVSYWLVLAQTTTTGSNSSVTSAGDGIASASSHASSTTKGVIRIRGRRSTEAISDDSERKPTVNHGIAAFRKDGGSSAPAIPKLELPKLPKVDLPKVELPKVSVPKI